MFLNCCYPLLKYKQIFLKLPVSGSLLSNLISFNTVSCNPLSKYMEAFFQLPIFSCLRNLMSFHTNCVQIYLIVEATPISNNDMYD